jgi:uncharacterized protein (TIGR00369 family)
MPNEEHYRKLEQMYSKAPINDFFQPELRIEEGKATLTMEIRPDFFHAANAVHGSVYFKALDDATFFAAQSLVTDVFVLTVSFTIYFLRPLFEGRVKTVGQVVHQSQRLIVAEGKLLDEEERIAGMGSGTFMRSRVRLSPEIGYR